MYTGGLVCWMMVVFICCFLIPSESFLERREKNTCNTHTYTKTTHTGSALLNSSGLNPCGIFHSTAKISLGKLSAIAVIVARPHPITEGSGVRFVKIAHVQVVQDNMPRFTRKKQNKRHGMKKNACEKKKTRSVKRRRKPNDGMH